MTGCNDCQDKKDCSVKEKYCKDCKEAVLPFVKKEGLLFCNLFELVVKEDSKCSSFKAKEWFMNLKKTKCSDCSYNKEVEGHEVNVCVKYDIPVSNIVICKGYSNDEKIRKKVQKGEGWG